MQRKVGHFIIQFLLLQCTVLAHRSSEAARFFEFAVSPGTNGGVPLGPGGAPVPTPTPDGPEPGPIPVPSPTPDPPAPSSTPLEDQSSGSSGGLSGGQKAGIAIGSIAGAGLLGFVGMIYKTRRSNIRRARFASAARTPML